MNGGHYAFQSWERAGGTDAPRARRPVGRSAATSARAWSERTFHRWSAIVRSPTVPPPISALLRQGDYLRLSALSVGKSRWMVGLCVFVFLCLRCFALCFSLCLCGSTGSCLYVTASPVWCGSRDFGQPGDWLRSGPRPSRAHARRARRALPPERPPPATAPWSGRRSNVPSRSAAP